MVFEGVYLFALNIEGVREREERGGEREKNLLGGGGARESS